MGSHADDIWNEALPWRQALRFRRVRWHAVPRRILAVGPRGFDDCLEALGLASELVRRFLFANGRRNAVVKQHLDLRGLATYGLYCANLFPRHAPPGHRRMHDRVAFRQTLRIRHRISRLMPVASEGAPPAGLPVCRDARLFYIFGHLH